MKERRVCGDGVASLSHRWRTVFVDARLSNSLPSLFKIQTDVEPWWKSWKESWTTLNGCGSVCSCHETDTSLWGPKSERFGVRVSSWIQTVCRTSFQSLFQTEWWQNWTLPHSTKQILFSKLFSVQVGVCTHTQTESVWESYQLETQLRHGKRDSRAIWLV